MKEACPDFAERLSAYADGELDAAEAQRVEEHVASCNACQDALLEWRAMNAALAASTPARSDVEWERLAQRVEAAIDAAEMAGTDDMAADEQTPSVLRQWIWRGSGALVAAALVLLFWPWVSNQTVETPPSLPRARPEESPPIATRPEEPALIGTPRPTTDEKAATPSTESMGATDERDVRRVAVTPETRGGLAPSPAPADSRLGTSEQVMPRAQSVPESRAPEVGEEAEPERKEGVRAEPSPSMDASSMDASSMERSERVERVPRESFALRSLDEGRTRETFDSLMARTHLALPDERTADGGWGSTKSLEKRPMVAEPDRVRVADPTAELEDLRELASAWDGFLASQATEDDRGQALASVVRVRDRLVQLDKETECEAALAVVESWRRDGAGGLEAYDAAERIESACDSR